MDQTKILVIDDEPGIREGCKRVLTPQGYQVDTAENGERGLAKIQSDQFDLVLIDVMMPGINGIDLISLIHQKDPECICIIITGYATVEMAITAIKRGAYDFLTKPFTTDELYLAVSQGLERRRLALEAKRLQAIEMEAQRLAQEKAKLEELDRAKAEFIRLVTHELQAPVAAVLSYLELMIKGYIPPEQHQEYLERARARAKETLELIADLLEYARLKELKTVGKAKPIHIDSILRQALAECETQAAEKQLKITTDISPGLPPICMAEDQVKSIWTNLISNAIKYTPPGGKILIILRQEGANILGQIIDTGIGIPDEDKGRLFTEFFRANNAKSMNIPGSGLGLAIVKQIINRAGGNIWLESILGKGSTFTFSLPVA